MSVRADVASGGPRWDAAAVQHGLRDAGVPAADCAGMVLESCWPLREQGYVARLRAGHGGWWGLAHYGTDAPPRAVVEGVTRGDIRELPELAAFAWQFANDPMIETGAALREAAAERSGRIESLAYKPLYRAALRRCAGLEAPVFLKLYPPAQDDATADIHAGLLETGRGGDVEVVVPAPASRRRELRALAWPELDGRSCYAALRESGRLAAAAMLGRALAALHASRVAWTRAHRVADELRTLDRWVRLAARLRPARAGRLRRAADLVTAAGARRHPGRLVASHRDFYDKQLLIQRHRAYLLDLDTACLAEPELDLANAAVHLRLRAMQGFVADAGALEAHFLEAYLASGGGMDPGRMRFYVACTQLRLACVYALRPAWERLSAGLAGAAIEGLNPNQQRRTGND